MVALVILRPSIYYCSIVRQVIRLSNQTSCRVSKLKYSTGSLINHPNVVKYLKSVEDEYNSLPDKNGPRSRDLSSIVHLIEQKKRFEKDIESLGSLDSDRDAEMKKLVEEERKSFVKEIESVNNQIISMINPEEEQHRDIILEVTAGVGGKEAMLFAAEVFSMYVNYAAYKKWSCDLDVVDTSDEGGVRHSSAFISGYSAMTCFLQEVGVHRVQRVPTTEKSGRIHTSTVAVSVLVQPTDVEIVLNNKDLKFETKTSSGAGGQHVNKTESCVRITHIPSGLVVECQTDRSQIKNKQTALKRLRAKLYQAELDKQIGDSKKTKKLQVGSSFRSEKVRTYNFNQDRVTDHRLVKSVHNLPGFLNGGSQLDEVISELVEQTRQQQFLNYVSQRCSNL